MRIVTGWLSLIYLSTLAMPAAGSQSFADPEGDTIGVGAIQYDVTLLTTEDLDDRLQLTFRFTSQQAAEQATGLIEFDLDQTLASGRLSRTSALCPLITGLGVDLTIDLFGRVGNQAPVMDEADNTLGQAEVTSVSNELIVGISKNLLGLETGEIDIAAVFGTGTEATDCVPDGDSTQATITLSQPMPSGIFQDRFEQYEPND